MFIFISSHDYRGLKIWDSEGKVAEFQNMGNYGCFKTEDEKIAGKLRNNREFGIAFNEVTNSKFGGTKDIGYKVEGENVIELVREKSEPPRVEETEPDMSKFVRFGELKGLLIKPDGQIKKTASKELIDEYQSLKTELNL